MFFTRVKHFHRCMKVHLWQKQLISALRFPVVCVLAFRCHLCCVFFQFCYTAFNRQDQLRASFSLSSDISSLQSFIKQKASIHRMFSTCLFLYSTDIKTLLNFNIHQIQNASDMNHICVPVLSLVVLLYILQVISLAECQQLESYRGKRKSKGS